MINEVGFCIDFLQFNDGYREFCATILKDGRLEIIQKNIGECSCEDNKNTFNIELDDIRVLVRDGYGEGDLIYKRNEEKIKVEYQSDKEENLVKVIQALFVLCGENYKKISDLEKKLDEDFDKAELDKHKYYHNKTVDKLKDIVQEYEERNHE